MRYFEKSDLPNQNGFMFIGLMADGTEKQLSVKRDSEGLHRIEGAEYNQVVKWRRLPY